jgi:hypothetical protein
VNGPDDELSLLTIANLAALLGQTRQTVVRLVESGAIPVAYVDRQSGERFFTRAVLAAQQRRIGELHAEAAAALRAARTELGVEPLDLLTEPVDEADDDLAAEEPVEPELPANTEPTVRETVSSLDRALNAAIARRNAEEFRSPTYSTTQPKRPRPAHT